ETFTAAFFNVSRARGDGVEVEFEVLSVRNVANRRGRLGPGGRRQLENQAVAGAHPPILARRSCRAAGGCDRLGQMNRLDGLAADEYRFDPDDATSDGEARRSRLGATTAAT